MTEIRGYTLGQLHAFLGSISDADREYRRIALITARAAQVDPDQFKNMLKELG